jgi:arabinoxylan arabinofuranohydrolase
VYVYTSHDADGQMGFDMIDYHAYSSDDLVNWQDHGVIIKAADLNWAPRLYAPDACEKNGKYYLYMPNQGSGIGVAVSDHPGGPFVDALGKPLIDNKVPGVEDVDWIFDPACFVDDDGQAYLYFGGGPENTGDNARVIRLNDNMTSLKDSSATVIPAPEFFEASFMHKRGSTYYFSYSTNFKGHPAYLDYMTSDNPMTGFQYRGTILTNGDINLGNNNHGSIIEFLGKSYLFYHNRKLEKDGGGDNSYQRSMAIQELFYEGDAIKKMDMSTEDFTIAQVKCLDGFSEVQAETIAAMRGIEVEGNGAVGVSVVDIDTGDWLGYSQVDFRDGAKTFVARVASAAGGGSIDVRIDGCDDFTDVPGTSIGTCEVPSTGGADTFTEISCPITETSGAHDLCLSFTGNKSFKLDSFRLE